jgi:hypothetical protein
MAHLLTRKFLAYLDRKRGSRSQIRISTDKSGIHLKASGGQVSAIPWDRITRIVACKRDVYSHDMICLLIEEDGKGVFELNEDMPGFAELANEMPVRLPSAKPYSDWFIEVAFPAFNPSPTSIFIRE